MGRDSFSINPAVQRFENIRQECIRKIDQVERKRNMEIEIIRQSLRRTKQEQIDDINKTSKFDLEGIKQECNTEAESNIAFEIVQMQKAKELRLLQQEEFARKDAEIEGEKIRRRIEEALSDE